jgi:phenylacetate-CoA ligase
MLNRIISNGIESDFLPASSLKLIQKKLLLKLWRHAGRHPLTSERLNQVFPTATVNEENIESIWRTIPISPSTDHDFLMNTQRTLIEELSPDAGASIVFTTGGTTGTPKLVWLSLQEVLTNANFHGKGYALAGIENTDKVATFGQLGLLSSEFTVYHGLNITGCRIFPIGLTSPLESLVELLVRTQATVLLVMPSDLIPLVEFLKKEGRKLENIRLIVTGGEKLKASSRKQIECVIGSFDLQFRSTFQSADTGTIGYPCTFGEEGDYHLHSELQYAEIVASPEGPKLVLTNLNRYLMPVIRVETGDLAEFLEGTCQCGRSTPRIRVLGRTGREIKIGGQKIPLDVFAKAQESLQLDLNEMAVKIRQDHLGRDVIEVYVKFNGSAPASNQVIKAICENSTFLTNQINADNIGPIRVKPLDNNKIKKTATGKIVLVEDLR